MVSTAFLSIRARAGGVAVWARVGWHCDMYMPFLAMRHVSDIYGQKYHDRVSPRGPVMNSQEADGVAHRRQCGTRSRREGRGGGGRPLRARSRGHWWGRLAVARRPPPPPAPPDRVLPQGSWATKECFYGTPGERDGDMPLRRRCTIITPTTGDPHQARLLLVPPFPSLPRTAPILFHLHAVGSPYYQTLVDCGATSLRAGLPPSPNSRTLPFSLNWMQRGLASARAAVAGVAARH